MKGLKITACCTYQSIVINKGLLNKGMHSQPPSLPTPRQRKIDSYWENTKEATARIWAALKPALIGQWNTVACHRVAGSYQLTMSRIIMISNSRVDEVVNKAVRKRSQQVLMENTPHSRIQHSSCLNSLNSQGSPTMNMSILCKRNLRLEVNLLLGISPHVGHKRS